MNLIEMVKAAGVVGAGGAGFPTHVKLNTNVEYFIVNAAECEPLIETDKYLCRTFADRIIRTIPQIAEAIGASKKVIALKGAYEKEIAALKVAIREQNSDVEIFELGYFYPAKIFMGDGGSLYLGFMLSTLSVLGTVKSATFVSMIIPVLVLGVPIFDTVFAILRRFVNKKPIMGADRGHLHHRLMNLG